MTLNKSEQQQLDEIGRCLAAENPALARDLSTPRPRTRGGRDGGRARRLGAVIGWSLLIAGLAMVISAAIWHVPALTVAGVLIAALFPAAVQLGIDLDSSTRKPR
ncbi:DUF3040 domain-containing protein [Pseudonocardia sp. GCM10023141]|uniref:DUF3040 domain-containing protein n=1 Tax=Pseudonocardia sp. GCM10023141 TaxID=3252653 RepID=UPI0036086D1F